ncbi:MULTISPECIES: ABC transporter ATP-binding protein [Lentihominibacter]|jgi:ABC transporter related|uniref:ATP-binding cassette domain-containing protein n=1 Tax=Lentihominibacter hominis TaxID=2763645 RepID=A0A926I9B5_9FIRM|nr:ATP-binding cassette domain-containing protein [Lentihominibacter hominis]MBC8567945.1 ATP-binding cassette domain-containing protein [Lentihominibacter hominis]
MQLKADNISFRYNDKSPWVLRNVNFTVESADRIALVGPSGYGKSTLSKILSGYLKPTEGKVLLNGELLPEKGYCPVQMVYQHPEQAVNPRWKMDKTLNECWKPDQNLLDSMGIEKEWLKRWPSELSGGELQRFCIARVLGPDTKFLICDEISTMLDVITQAQIWQLVLEISEERNIGLVVVTHNMALAEKVCNKIVRLPEISVQKPEERISV